MRFISTKVHGVLDYIVGVLLIAAPWIFNFDNGSAAQWIPVSVGVVILIMSLMTNYEAGAMKVVPMRIHLTLDVIAGIFLAASPWLFRFSNEVSTPHVIVGILAICSGLFTETRPHGQAFTERDDRRDSRDMRHAH